MCLSSWIWVDEKYFRVYIKRTHPKEIYEMQIYTTDTHFVFVFGYNPELIELVKGLPERRFCSPKFRAIPADKYWSVPREYESTVRAFAKAYRFQFVGDIPEPKKIAPPPKTDLIPYTLPDLSKPLGLRKIVLYSHQKAGVAWLAERRKAILADDMGLGKTMQALLAAAAYNLPNIVICPATLQQNWKNEAAAIDVPLHSVFSWAKFPDSITGDYVLIVDEAHYAQAGSGSMRGKKFLHLSKYARAVFCLTGTPMKNGRPINLLPLLIATNHPIAKDVRNYHIRYCDAKKTPWSHWDVTGARNLDELHQKTKDTILRRMKKDCLDLPAKTRVVRDADVSAEARAAYNKMFGELQSTYRDRVRKGIIGTGGEELVLMNHIRHAASMAKVDSAVILGQEALDEQGAVVVFTAFEASARAISERLGGCLLTGSTPIHTRQGLVDDFQSKGGAFVSTIRAGGVGITLTKASTVIMSDREWTPGDVMQAEDRLHRIGQGNNVLSVWLQYDDSDKAVDAILERKEERIELVLAGKRKTMKGTGSVNDVAKQVAAMVLG